MESTASPVANTNGNNPTPSKINGDITSISTTVPAIATLSPNVPPAHLVVLAAYPITVLLGILSNYPQDSYFSRKDNFVNVYFLKFTWAWSSIVFFAHVARIPQKLAPLARYAMATIWWILVTQWCFGGPIMDRVFRGTGGVCQLAKNEDFPDIITSAICRSSGGAWNGGHDLV
jgi:hypothetical protein